MKSIIKKISEGNNLTFDESKRAMNIILSGEATEAQIGSYLMGLKMKGETIDEITGSATALKEKAASIEPSANKYIDIVGTGGDGSNTFNISTTTSIVVAASGLTVAKHGNRAISSKSGAADLLEALKINIMLEPEKVKECIDKIGIGFMFAPMFHKSMKYVGSARSEMGIRSIFNILGPLSNPSGAKAQLVGVYDKKLTDVFAKAMLNMGVERAMVVNAENKMDEISISCETTVSEIKDGKILNYTIKPEDFRIKRVSDSELKGGNAKENAKITIEILNGAKGPKTDIVLLNAGAALYIGGVTDTIQDGIKIARETIQSKKAIQKLLEMIDFK